MSITSESKYTRLEQIRHNIADYKALVLYWQRLETEELILTSDQQKDKDNGQ